MRGEIKTRIAECFVRRSSGSVPGPLNSVHIPAIAMLQEKYVRVIDAVIDLDNVLYPICGTRRLST